MEDTVKSSFERDVDDARSLDRRHEKSSTVERSNARRDFVNDRFRGWKKRSVNESWNFLHYLAYSSESLSAPWTCYEFVSSSEASQHLCELC